MTDRDRLAEYQARLLELLYRNAAADYLPQQIQQLAKDTDQPLGQVDLRMADVGSLLTTTWGLHVDKETN